MVRTMTGGAVTFPFEVIKTVMDHFHQLNVHKSMESDGIHCVVLKEQILLKIFQRLKESWEIPTDES